jgi:tetratricopeptide (TPR) repeat protein
MFIRRAAVALLPLSILLLAAAAAPSEPDAEELIRRANAAFERNELAEAERLYGEAEVLTADPGLVAFNRATVLFQRAERSHPELYSEAARGYALALSDPACPPERAARAWYNRGTCLLRQPGATMAVYRSAIACLERCLELDVADPPLRANAAYNLKLAKLLWNEARRKEKKEGSPNDDIPPEDPRSEHPPEHSPGIDQHAGNQEPGEGNAGAETSKMMPQHAAATAVKGAMRPGAAQDPGASGKLQQIEDLRDLRSLNPEETRQELHRTAERLRRDRQIMRMTLYGAERTGLHDW